MRALNATFFRQLRNQKDVTIATMASETELSKYAFVSDGE